MQEIRIVVDTNDADYLTSVRIITDEDLAKIMPMIEAIKAFKPYKVKSDDSIREWTHPYNYHIGEYVREDLGEKTVEEIYPFGAEMHELFQSYCPYGEFGFHTIESIEVYPVPDKVKLL